MPKKAVRAVYFGRSKEDSARLSKETFLTFTAGSRCAVKIEEIQEIIDLPKELLRPPGLSSHFAGVVNLRGTSIVPIVDRRKFVAPTQCEDAPQGQVMIFDVDGGKAGVIVESIDSIVTVQQSDKLTFPNTSGELDDSPNECMQTISRKGVTGRNASCVIVKMKMLLDGDSRGCQLPDVQSRFENMALAASGTSFAHSQR